MSGRDWFLVGCRLFGVWVAYRSLTYITAYLDIRMGYTEEVGPSSHPGGLLIHGFGHVLLALYLLFGTRHLAWLCFEHDGPTKGEGPSPGLPTERELA